MPENQHRTLAQSKKTVIAKIIAGTEKPDLIKRMEIFLRGLEPGATTSLN
jgi:hypothetical protein